MPRKRLAFGLVAILLLGVRATDGEVPPRPPDLAIGVIPFTRVEGGPNCHIEQHIRNLLDIHGARVTLLDASIDVPAAFASHPDLDFVVTGALIAGNTPTVFTKVFARGNGSPRTESGACDVIAAAVARKVMDNHAAGKTLASREALAKATLASNPDDFHSLMTLGLLNLHANRWAEAGPFFERAVKNRPDDPQAHLNLALYYKQHDDRDNWLLHLTTAEKINPDEDGVLVALGNYYAGTGDHQRAVGYYERAKNFGLNTDVAHWNLAVVYSEMRKIDLALASLAAIPATSLYYTEAQPWGARLAEEKRLVDQTRQREAIPRRSLWSLLGLPDGVAILFVGVALVLCLVPYLAARSSSISRFLRHLEGSALRSSCSARSSLVGVLALFPSMWRDTAIPVPEPQPFAPPAVVEADRSESSAKYPQADENEELSPNGPPTR